MTHQFDMMLGNLDPAVLEHAAEQLPKAREVKRHRLHGYEATHIVVDDLTADARNDVATAVHRVLTERAREDHR